MADASSGAVAQTAARISAHCRAPPSRRQDEYGRVRRGAPRGLDPAEHVRPGERRVDGAGRARAAVPVSGRGVRDGMRGGRPWELPGEDVDDEDGSVHWISAPEPPIRELLCPAWLLESSRLEGQGRVRACGRDALDVVVTRRPSVRRRSVPAGLRAGPTEVLVDAELGFLLRVAEMAGAAEPEVTELVSADFDPVID